jgi:hypothetical protein
MASRGSAINVFLRPARTFFMGPQFVTALSSGDYITQADGAIVHANVDDSASRRGQIFKTA